VGKSRRSTEAGATTRAVFSDRHLSRSGVRPNTIKSVRDHRSAHSLDFCGEPAQRSVLRMRWQQGIPFATIPKSSNLIRRLRDTLCASINLDLAAYSAASAFRVTLTRSS